MNDIQTKKNNLLTPPSQKEIEELQKHNLNMFTPMSESELTSVNKTYEEIKKEQNIFDAEFPIFKKDENYIQRYADKMEASRQRIDEIEKLERTPLRVLITEYLENLKPETKRNYAYYFNDMIRRNLLPAKDANGNEFSVGQFNLVNHERQIDYIKKIDDWCEGTKQLKCACYISLTKYLERISRGWFRPAVPNNLGQNPTFFAVREKVATKALSLNEWQSFIGELHKIDIRASLIARMLFQGAKRISESLSLKLDQIDWNNNIIRFQQKKTGGMIKEIPITYPKYFMNEMKKYIEETNYLRKDSTVFITRHGKPVVRSRINDSFLKASSAAGIQHVHPHMLRATYITICKQQNISDSEIQKISGHMNSKMVMAYDKNILEENISKKLTLI